MSYSKALEVLKRCENLLGEFQKAVPEDEGPDAEELSETLEGIRALLSKGDFTAQWAELDDSHREAVTEHMTVMMHGHRRAPSSSLFDADGFEAALAILTEVLDP